MQLKKQNNQLNKTSLLLLILAILFFQNDDLKDYQKYKCILLDFQKKYGLEDFNLKQIDKYLWQLGKEKFPKNYGKGKK